MDNLSNNLSELRMPHTIMGSSQNNQLGRRHKDIDWLNRSVQSTQATVSINLDCTAPKCSTNVNGRAVFRYLPFEFKGDRFNFIPGNSKANHMSLLISQHSPETDILFSVRTSRGLSEFKPSKEWQERFLKVVKYGMTSFMEKIPYDGRGGWYELNGIRYNKPTCVQFTNFMEFEAVSFYNMFDISSELLKENNVQENFVILGIVNGNEPVHEFIHIGDEVCIGKLGCESVFFHTIDDVLSFYNTMNNKTLQLVVYQKKLRV